MKNELVNNAFKKDIESLKVKVEHLENVRRHTSSNLNRSELGKTVNCVMRNVHLIVILRIT